MLVVYLLRSTFFNWNVVILISSVNQLELCRMVYMMSIVRIAFESVFFFIEKYRFFGFVVMSMPVWYTFIGFLHFILHCNCNTIKNHFSVTDNPCNLGIHWFYFCVLGLVVLATEFYSNIFLGVAWRPTNAKQFIFRLSTLIHIDTTGTNAFTVNEIEMIRENCLLCEINSCRFVVGLTRLAEANERQKKRVKYVWKMEWDGERNG